MKKPAASLMKKPATILRFKKWRSSVNLHDERNAQCCIRTSKTKTQSFLVCHWPVVIWCLDRLSLVEAGTWCSQTGMGRYPQYPSRRLAVWRLECQRPAMWCCTSPTPSMPWPRWQRGHRMHGRYSQETKIRWISLAEVTLNGGLVKASPQNPLNSGLGNILICPVGWQRQILFQSSLLGFDDSFPEGNWLKTGMWVHSDGWDQLVCIRKNQISQNPAVYSYVTIVIINPMPFGEENLHTSCEQWPKPWLCAVYRGWNPTQ